MAPNAADHRIYLAQGHDRPITRVGLICLLFSSFSFGQDFGPEILVNDDTSGGAPHYSADVAFTPDGQLLVVWEDYRKSDYDANIYCQRFAADGSRVDTNWVVNQDTLSRNIWVCRQARPAIAATTSGFAVVCWEDYRRGTSHIYYQLLDRQSRPVGRNRAVCHDTLGGDNHAQTEPDVSAMGNQFVITWTQAIDGRGSTIYAALIDSVGNAGPVFNVASNIITDSCEASAVAGYNAGFVVAWYQRSTTNGVMMRQFDRQGSPRGSPTRLDVGNARRPRVACDSAGNAIIIWEEDVFYPTGVRGKAYDASGNPRGDVFPVSDSLGVWSYHPCIAADLTGETFVVAWEDGRLGAPRIFARLLDQQGHPLSEDFQMDPTRSIVAQGTPATAIHNRQQYAAAWEDNREGCGNINGACWGSSRGSGFRANTDRASAIQDFPVAVMDGTGRTSVFWFDCRADPANARIYGQRFNELLEPLGRNFLVSDPSPEHQCWFLWAARNASGATVVAWQDTRNGDPDIYAQLYDARGNPRGGNFRVNDDNSDAQQTWPFVAINDSGYSIITWNDTRNGDFAPYLQRYDCAGTRMGSNTRIATSGVYPFPLLEESGNFWVVWAGDQVRARRFDTESQQWDSLIRVSDDTGHVHVYPKLLLTESGTLWVTWMDQRRGNWDVYVQRLAHHGTLLGHNIRVNDDSVVCEHWLPSFAAIKPDRICVAWTDLRELGNLDIRAQIYDTAGTRLDTNFIVNTDPWPGTGQWAYGTVAARNGRTVFAWIDNRNLRSWDVYIRAGLPTTPRHWWQGLEVMPSPAQSSCRIKPVLLVQGPARLQVFDIAGRLRADYVNLQLSDISDFITLDCDNLPAGIYSLLLKTAEATLGGRLVKLR